MTLTVLICSVIITGCYISCFVYCALYSLYLLYRVYLLKKKDLEKKRLRLRIFWQPQPEHFHHSIITHICIKVQIWSNLLQELRVIAWMWIYCGNNYITLLRKKKSWHDLHRLLKNLYDFSLSINESKWSPVLFKTSLTLILWTKTVETFF